MHGFRIIELDRPGRLGRLEIQLREDGVSALRSLNVRALEAPSRIRLEVDGQSLSLAAQSQIARADNGAWTRRAASPRRTGPAIQITDGQAPIVLLCDRAHLGTAQRLAHGLHIYSLPRATIVLASEALDRVQLLNASYIVAIGAIDLPRALQAANQPRLPCARALAAARLTRAVRIEPSRFTLHGRVFDQPGYGSS